MNLFFLPVSLQYIRRSQAEKKSSSPPNPNPQIPALVEPLGRSLQLSLSQTAGIMLSMQEGRVHPAVYEGCAVRLLSKP